MQQQTEQLSDGQRLNAAQIWAFLAKATVGRLATHDHARNQSNLTPLFFVCEAPHIYFATQPGHKLNLLRRYPQGVGLQADAFEPESSTSVFVWGRYRDVPLGAEYAHATRLLAFKYGTGFWQQIIDQATKQGYKPEAIPSSFLKNFGETVLLVIQQELGHSEFSTTQKYLQQLVSGYLGLTYHRIWNTFLDGIRGTPDE